MFDLVSGDVRHIPNHNAVPLLASSLAEAAAVTLIIAVPLLFVANTVPEIPSMMAFVAAVPPPPPPPPPPPRAEPAKQAAVASGPVVPLQAPAEIKPEQPGPIVDDGVPGGVEGGIPGGVVGGITGMFEAAPPPPPPPPAPVQNKPVRIAGDVQAPALLRRVEPIYPAMAVAARVAGVVILEATVNEKGIVEDVRVLRSVHPLVDKEAVAAVRQWQYSPLTLNGHASPFILTVTLSFALVEKK